MFKLRRLAPLVVTAAAACSRPDAPLSTVSVVDGTPCADHFPATTGLIIRWQDPDHTAHTTICSGAFIAKTGAVLTAAHCLTVPQGATLLDVTAFGHLAPRPLVTNHIAIHPRYHADDESRPGADQAALTRFDIGLVLFPEGPTTPAPLATTTPPPGSPATFAGFGRAYPDRDPRSVGACRSGARKLATVDGQGVIAFTTPLNEKGFAATTAAPYPNQGDSGGPLFTPNGTIIGLVSHADYTVPPAPPQGGTLRSLFTDVTTPTARTFIAEALSARTPAALSLTGSWCTYPYQGTHCLDYCPTAGHPDGFGTTAGPFGRAACRDPDPAGVAANLEMRFDQLPARVRALLEPASAS